MTLTHHNIPRCAIQKFQLLLVAIFSPLLFRLDILCAFPSLLLFWLCNTSPIMC